MAKAAELIKYIRDNYSDDEEIAYSIWSAGDIGLDDEDGDDDYSDLTEEDKRAIIENLHENQSADYGIDWDSLNEEIRTRRETKEKYG